MSRRPPGWCGGARAGRVQSLESSSRLRVSSAAISTQERACAQDAASSMPSGWPPSARQIRAIARRSVWSGAKCPRARRATSQKSMAALLRSIEAGASSGGVARPPSSSTHSPRSRSRSREVARMVRRGARSSSGPRAATPSRSCSRLSSSSSTSMSRRCRAICPSAPSVPLRLRPSAVAMAGSNMSAALMAASGTKRAPSAKWLCCAATVSRARRVLPLPPSPAIVISRQAGSAR